MGQIVNPIGFRVGYAPAWLWRDFWCVKSLYYSEYLHNILFFRDQLDSLFHFYMQRNYGFCYSHFCIYKRLNRFYIGVYFYGGAHEHGIQTGVKNMLWGRVVAGRRDRQWRLKSITYYCRALLGQMFRFEKLGTVAWLFHGHSKYPYKIRNKERETVNSVRYANFQAYDKWKFFLPKNSVIKWKKLVNEMKHFYVWFDSIPWRLRYFMWMLPPYLRLKVRATDAKLWDQKGAIIHDSSFYKWSLADFYSSEKPDAYGAFGRKIALPGLQVRRRGGFTRWTGGVVCGPRYVDKTEIKRKDGSVINVYEEVNDPLRRRSIGSNYKKEYVILRHKFRRQGESYRWRDRWIRTGIKIRNRKQGFNKHILNKRMRRTRFIVDFICDNLYRIYVNMWQNSLSMIEYMASHERAWGREALLRLDWLWHASRRRHLLRERVAALKLKPRTDIHSYQTMMRIQARTLFFEKSARRRFMSRLTIIIDRKGVWNKIYKKSYQKSWRDYLAGDYWKYKTKYKGYSVEPYDCNFSKFEKFQEYREFRQLIRLKWLFNVKRYEKWFYINMWGYRNYQKRSLRFLKYFRHLKRKRKKLILNFKEEWFTHPTYMHVFWPRVIAVRCFLRSCKGGVEIARRRFRLTGRRLFFSALDALKDFGSMQFMGLLPLMMRNTSKPVFTDALKVSKSGHKNALHKLQQYFDPVRRLLEKRGYMWREHIFIFRAFFSKFYMDILRFTSYVESGFFAYKTYAFGHLTVFKALSSFPFKMTYYVLTNKDVTATMISRYISIKLTQGFHIWSLLNPIRKELMIMSKIRHKDRLLGFKFKLAGRFKRRQRVSRIWIRSGMTPFSTVDSCVEYCGTTVAIDHGTYTVKLWIFKNSTRISHNFAAIEL